MLRFSFDVSSRPPSHSSRHLPSPNRFYRRKTFLWCTPKVSTDVAASSDAWRWRSGVNPDAYRNIQFSSERGRPIVTSNIDVTIGRNLTTICGLGPPMIKVIGEALNNACMAPETKTRAGKSLLKSFLFLSSLIYLLLPSAATPFHLPPY